MTSAVLAGLGLVVPLSVSGPVRQRLVIREQAPSRRIFRSVPISDDDVVAMTWMHSVDKTPWWEYYSPVDGELVLDCTDLALMGAGTPFDAPQTEIDGDKVRLWTRRALPRGAVAPLPSSPPPHLPRRRAHPADSSDRPPRPCRNDRDRRPMNMTNDNSSRAETKEGTAEVVSVSAESVSPDTVEKYDR